jgi:chromosome segregation ATPase
MSDSAEFQTLSALEARLASALDRIADGLGPLRARRMDDPDMTSAVMEDALATADAARTAEAVALARVAEMEAKLAAATPVAAAADDAADDTALKDMTAARDALDAARKADADDARRMAKTRDEAVAAAKAELEEARAANADLRDRLSKAQEAATARNTDGTVENLSVEFQTLRGRVARLRLERNDARQERDEATDQLDELRAMAGGEDRVDALVLTLRAELRSLQGEAEMAAIHLEQLQATPITDAAGVNAAMTSELRALRAARAAEAAELARVLDEMRPLIDGDAAHA